jgi:hypothetical protein
MSGSVRFDVVQAMIADPMNRLCIEYLYATAKHDKIYPPPLKTNPTGFLIAPMPVYLQGQNAAVDFDRLKPGEKPAARVYLVEDGYEVSVVMPSQSEDVFLGPFGTTQEALDEVREYFQTLGIQVAESAPWDG